MPDNIINVRDLNKVEEITNDDLLIVETANGTNTIEFRNFVTGPENVSWFSTFQTVSTNLVALSAAEQIKPIGKTTMIVLNTPGQTATIPVPVGVNTMKVTLVGGGGGGGNSTAGSYTAGGGGGSGSIAVRYFTGITTGQSYTYAIGSGGAGGLPGTQSSFSVGTSNTVIAPGGSAGSNGTNSSVPGAGGQGGVLPTNGTLNLYGSDGFNGQLTGTLSVTVSGILYNIEPVFSCGGQGAPGFMGSGAGRGGISTGSADSGINGEPGSGAGGGGGARGGSGGSGGGGLILIEY